MPGVLLGGWRVRIGDENYDPLYPGRVQFFEASTQTPKTVYADYLLDTPLGVEVETDQDGYLPAIFLNDDGLYKCNVQRKISDDPETWEDLWDLNNVGVPDQNPTGAGTGVIAYCRTVAEMKAISPGTISAAIVAGYYAPGDTDSNLFFVWEEGSDEADDGGAFIKANETLPTSLGAYHQVFNDLGNIDVRSYGWIPDGIVDGVGPIVNLQNYCKRGDVFNRPPRICFSAGISGTYEMSGAVSLGGKHTANPGSGEETRLTYKIESGVKFSGDGVELILEGPTIVETRETMVSDGMTLTVNKGAVDFVRPDWWPNNQSYPTRVETAANNSEAPIYVDHPEPISWSGNENLTINAPKCVFFSGTRFAPPTGTTVVFNCKLESQNKDEPIFTDQDEFEVNPPTVFTGVMKISAEATVRMTWFGYGAVADNNQYEVVSKVFNTFIGEIEDQSPTVVFSEIGEDYYIGTDTGSGGAGPTTGGQVARSIFEGVVKIGSDTDDTIIQNLSLVDESTRWNFDCASGSAVVVDNGFVMPQWFGIGSVSLSDQGKRLQDALYSAYQSGAVLRGIGKKIQITTPLSLVIASPEGKRVEVDGLFVEAAPGFSGSTVLVISGDEDVILEGLYIELDVSLRSSVTSLAVQSYYQRVRNCFFRNGIGLEGGDVECSGNQQIGEKDNTDACIFVSRGDGVAFNVDKNTFNGSRVYADGELAVTGGNDYPTLKNFRFTNNTLISNGDVFNGCITLRSNALNTLVIGCIIKGNTFGGFVVSNGSSLQDDINRTRIRNALLPGSTWYNEPEATRNHYHTLLIDDNNFSRGRYEVGGEFRTQNVPTTKGSYLNDDDATGKITIPNGVQETTIEFNLPVTRMFLLEGDTDSNFSQFDFVAPWYRYFDDILMQNVSYPYTGGIAKPGIYIKIADVDGQDIPYIRQPMFPVPTVIPDTGKIYGTVLFEIYGYLN